MKLFWKTSWLLFLLLFVSTLSAQNKVVWKKTFGTAKNDGANKIIPTNDGQLLIVGFRQSATGSLDLLVFKTDINGALIWEKTFGGNQAELGYDGVELENGHWLIVGEKQTTSEGTNIYLLEIDSDGNLVFEKSIGGPYNELPKSIFIAEDGNIMIGGTQNIDPVIPSAMLMKLDRNGNELWTKNVNEIKTTPASTETRVVVMEEGESANIVIQSMDDGFLMAGNTMTDVKGGLSTDAWLCKMDVSGNKVWSKHFGAFGGDDLKGLFEDESGNIFVTGENYDKTVGKVSMWLLKFSPTGDLIFEKKYAEASKFLGGSSTLGAYKNIWIVGTTFNDEKSWRNCSSLSLSEKEQMISEGWELKETSKGAYLTYDNLEKNPESMLEQIMIAQFDTTGRELWRKLIDREKDERALSVCYINGCGIFVTGVTYDGAFGMMDVFVLKIVGLSP